LAAAAVAVAVEQWQLIMETPFIVVVAVVLLVALTMQMAELADTELVLTQNQVLVGLAKTLT
jgi:hypothetical protein